MEVVPAVNGSVLLRGGFAGLAPSATGAVRVYAGASCAEATAVLGAVDGAAAPWRSDADGAAALDDVRLDAAYDAVLGRVLVVDNDDGTRAGCGVVGAFASVDATAACPTPAPTRRPTASPTKDSKMHVAATKRVGLNFAGFLIIAFFACGPLWFGICFYPPKSDPDPPASLFKGESVVLAKETAV